VKNIILVGFMGTGKSAVGHLLAKRLKYRFVDLDERIQKKAGATIAQIFAKEGEPGFRVREAQEVKAAAELESYVIATGGGVMLDEANVRLLKRAGTVVCLTARPEVIFHRTTASLPSRPLLGGADPQQRIEELLKLRAPFYAQADLAVETSDRSIQDVVDEIMEKIK